MSNDLPDIEKYLTSKGISYSGTREIAIECIVCHEGGSAGRKKRLHINNKGDDHHGRWRCKNCDAKGNWNSFRKQNGDPPEGETIVSDRSQLAIHVAAKLYKGALRPEDVTYLKNSRGLTEKTIKVRCLGYAPGGTWLYDQMKADFTKEELIGAGLAFEPKDGSAVRDMFSKRLTIPYIVNDKAIWIKARDLTGEAQSKYMTTRGSARRLYNSEDAWANDEIVICEGEFDAMIMSQLGFAAVGVPGATGWESSWTAFFTSEELRRVWIMYDPDQDGHKGAVTLQELLGPKAKIVDLPVPGGVQPKQVDPTYLVVFQDWNKDNFDILLEDTVKKTSLLWTPYDALDALNEDEKVGGYKTGWDVFDRTIKKGIRRANVVIPIARTNVGKTLMILNMMQRMSMVPEQKDMKMLLLTLEQTRSEWLSIAERIWYFYNVTDVPMSRQQVREGAALYWNDRMRAVDKNRITEADVYATVEDYRHQLGGLPDIIFIDYLGYFANGYPGAQAIDRVSAAARGAKGIAKELNRPIVIPTQGSRKTEHGRELSLDDARDSGEIENIADMIIALWSEDTMKGRSAGDRTGGVNAKFLKMRGPGKGKDVKFGFAPLSLVWIASDELKWMPFVKQEIRWDNDGDVDWYDAINAHATGVAPERGRKGL